MQQKNFHHNWLSGENFLFMEKIITIHKHIINMNISDLFEEIQERFSPDDLSGELVLHGNCIVWSYKVTNDCEEYCETSEYEEDDEACIDFESVSCEELLQDAYNEDSEKIETFLDELNQTDNWTFSDADIVDDNISFKIF